MAALNAKGMRCVAPDRRGHGRSEVAMKGYDLDTLTDDLAMVMEERDLREAILVAHSMGSIEAVNYLARNGANRVSRLVLVAPTTPLLLQSPDNPDGVPLSAIENGATAIAADFPKWLADNTAPFFMPETPAETHTWVKAMMLRVPLPVALACQKTISTADLRAQARMIRCPTLIVQGDRDASAPLALTGVKTAKLIPSSTLEVYEGAPHGLVLTHKDRLLKDLLNFVGT